MSPKYKEILSTISSVKLSSRWASPHTHTHTHTHTHSHTHVDRMLAQTCTRLALSMLLHSHCPLTAHLCFLTALSPHISALSLHSHRTSLLSHFQQRVNPGETFVSGQYAVEYSMHNTLDFACVVSLSRPSHTYLCAGVRVHVVSAHVLRACVFWATHTHTHTCTHTHTHTHTHFRPCTKRL
jgi:hypothetical protein